MRDLSLCSGRRWTAGEWSIFERRRSHALVEKPRAAVQNTAFIVIHDLDGLRVVVAGGIHPKVGRFKRSFWFFKVLSSWRNERRLVEWRRCGVAGHVGDLF